MRAEAMALIVCGVLLQLAWAGSGPVQVLALLGLFLIFCGVAVWEA